MINDVFCLTNLVELTEAKQYTLSLCLVGIYNYVLRIIFVENTYCKHSHVQQSLYFIIRAYMDFQLQ
jgi:hypothetical protein